MTAPSEGQAMNGLGKLVGLAAIAVTAAVASFHGDVALALGLTALVAAGFIAITILVGAATATHHPREQSDNRRAPSLGATPVASSVQKR